jgi:subfamily B ATP-binding cassette protein HlyB/CyaB
MPAVPGYPSCSGASQGVRVAHDPGAHPWPEPEEAVHERTLVGRATGLGGSRRCREPTSRQGGRLSQVSEDPARGSEFRDGGLLALLIVCRFLGIAADAEGLRREFGKPGPTFGETELVRAARSLGLKARFVTTRWARLGVIALPALARMRDGRWTVLARADAETTLVQDPRAARPEVISREAFESAWAGELILLARRAAPRSAPRPFGFAWFLPAIAKYRWFLAEVLFASLGLQIFALVTPLFFQVVIDKVLVHRGLTTLHALAVGMLALAAFEAILGGLRTYLFTHTSSRIDVELGVQLFRHILALNMSYFESRRLG